MLSLNTVLLTVSGDGKPNNINTNEIDLNNGGWIVIGILIAIIAILMIKDIVVHYKQAKKFSDLNTLASNGLNEDETNLIIKYRKLDSRDKTVIKDTLSSLCKEKEDNLTDN